MGIVGALLMAFGFWAVEPVFHVILTVLSAGVLVSCKKFITINSNFCTASTGIVLK